jgi:hypothetical protein
MKKFASYLTLCCLAAVPALAQVHPSFYVGGGPSVPTNPLARRVDTGWNVSAGGGITGNRLGLMLDFTFNDFAINQNALTQVQAPDGRTRIWAFTLDPVVHLSQEGPVDFYITGGGGIYHRTVEFTSPGVASTTFFDPWFGFYPGLVPVNNILASYSTYRGGVDGGVGLAFRLGSSHAKIFAEARYHHMFLRQIDNAFIPVTIGVRW